VAPCRNVRYKEHLAYGIRNASLPSKFKFLILYRGKTSVDWHVTYCLLLNLFGEAVSTADVINSAELNYPDVCPFNYIYFNHFLASLYHLPPPLPATIV
jgi:hypothetical protein